MFLCFDDGIGKPVDMWAFGVILYILLGGYPPFHDDNQRRLFRKIMAGEFQFHEDYWGGVSDEAKSLIKGLLNINMHQRFTVEQCLTHPWLERSAQELEARNLETNLTELRKYQATKKLRAGVKAVMAVNRMKNLMGAAAAAEKEKAEGGGASSALIALDSAGHGTAGGDDNLRVTV